MPGEEVHGWSGREVPVTRIALIAAALFAVGALQFLIHTVLEGHRILAESGLLGGGQVVRVETTPQMASHTEAARVRRASFRGVEIRPGRLPVIRRASVGLLP